MALNLGEDKRLVNETCLDLLLIETVSTLTHTALDVPLTYSPSVNPKKKAQPAPAPPSTLDISQVTHQQAALEQETAYFKLETIGFRVGLAMADRLCKDRPRFLDTLDMIKFICKDFWISCFKKQVDNLKTNHKGVYVLTDNQFKWFTRISDKQASDASKQAFPHLAIPCGIIRGALANLGLSCVVIAEISTLPTCK